MMVRAVSNTARTLLDMEALSDKIVGYDVKKIQNDNGALSTVRARYFIFDELTKSACQTL